MNISQRLAGPVALPVAEAIAYSAPGAAGPGNSTPVLIKSMMVCNASGAAATVTAHLLAPGAAVGTAAAGNALGVAVPVAVGAVVSVLPATVVLEPGESISWVASVAAALTGTLTGTLLDREVGEVFTVDY